jgi:hypothetical protein
MLVFSLIHSLNRQICARVIFSLILGLVVLAPMFVYAEHLLGDETEECGVGQLCNPVKANNLEDFLRDVVRVIVRVGIPVSAIFVIYSGYLFVSARGSEDRVKHAKQVFWYAIIGTAVLLGAWVIITVIADTIKELGEGVV